MNTLQKVQELAAEHDTTSYTYCKEESGSQHAEFHTVGACAVHLADLSNHFPEIAESYIALSEKNELLSREHKKANKYMVDKAFECTKLKKDNTIMREALEEIKKNKEGFDDGMDVITSLVICKAALSRISK